MSFTVRTGEKFSHILNLATQRRQSNNGRRLAFAPATVRRSPPVMRETQLTKAGINVARRILNLFDNYNLNNKFTIAQLFPQATGELLRVTDQLYQLLIY
jgi:hypothetical protein